MRVLLVHKFLHITGGAEVFLFETAKALTEAGHEVAFMSTQDAENEVSPWSRYFTRAPQFRSGNPLARIASVGPIVHSFAAAKSTRALIQEFRPDVAHVFNVFTHLSPSVLKACADSGVPVLMSCNDYKHICPNYKLYHHGRICEECADGHFMHAVRNRCCQDSLAFSVAGAIESSVHAWTDVVRSNVDTFLFSSDFMAHKTEEFWGRDSFAWGKLRNPFDSPAVPESFTEGDYVLFVGRFVEEKGAELLVRAAAHAPHIPIVLVGSGPEELRICGLVESLAIKNVRMVGPKWGVELDGYLAGARFVVVPSIWHENYPYVVLQSFAHGKAIIGANRGGIPELVESGSTGVLFEPDDLESLVTALSELWDDPDRSRAMGHAAKEYSDASFNPGVFIDELASCYRGVVT